MSRDEAFDALEKTGRHAYFGILVGAMPITAGILQRIYATEITNAWPLGAWPGAHWQVIWPAFFFFAIIVTWLPSFVFREWARERQVKRLQTIPLGGFITGFGEIVSKVENRLVREVPHKAGESILKDKQNKAVFIRDLLRAVAKLAALYDQERTGARYAAHVMVFVPQSAFDDNIRGILRFCDPTEIDNLKGALVLSQQLSSTATAAEQSAEIDDQVADIALAVPGEGSRIPILPGAPQVFLQRGDPGISKRLCTHIVDDIRTWDFKKMGLGTNEIEELKKYYSDDGQGRAVRSFISFPLISGGATIFGVLNVYCNLPKWIGGESMRKSNSSILLLPLVNEISSVVDPDLGP